MFTRSFLCDTDTPGRALSKYILSFLSLSDKFPKGISYIINPGLLLKGEKVKDVL